MARVDLPGEVLIPPSKKEYAVDDLHYENIFIKTQGLKIYVEYRIGPEVVGEAQALRCPGGWIIEGITVEYRYRRKGIATAIIKYLNMLSRGPVCVLAISSEALDFWRNMVADKLCKETTFVFQDDTKNH